MYFRCLDFAITQRDRPKNMDSLPRIHVPLEDASDKSKKILFVRHSISEWNVMGARQNPIKFIFALLSGLIREISQFYIPFTSVENPDQYTRNSLLVDSPLTEGGMNLTVETRLDLINAVKDSDTKVRALCVLNTVENNKTEYTICASPLRRSLATAALISFGGKNAKQPILYLLPSLQELGPNMDTLTLHDPDTRSPLNPKHVNLNSPIRVALSEAVEKISFNRIFYTKDKTNFYNAYKRLSDYISWIFTSTVNGNTEYIVTHGHSLWLQLVFRHLISKDAYDKLSESDKYLVDSLRYGKLTNCGVISFTISLDEHGFPYVEIPSIEILTGTITYRKSLTIV